MKIHKFRKRFHNLFKIHREHENTTFEGDRYSNAIFIAASIHNVKRRSGH